MRDDLTDDLAAIDASFGALGADELDVDVAHRAGELRRRYRRSHSAIGLVDCPHRQVRASAKVARHLL